MEIGADSWQNRCTTLAGLRLLCLWHQTRGGTGGSNFFSEDVLSVAPQPPSFPPSPGGLAWALAVELIYLDQFSVQLTSRLCLHFLVK